MGVTGSPLLHWRLQSTCRGHLLKSGSASFPPCLQILHGAHQPHKWTLSSVRHSRPFSTVSNRLCESQLNAAQPHLQHFHLAVHMLGTPLDRSTALGTRPYQPRPGLTDQPPQSPELGEAETLGNTFPSMEALGRRGGGFKGPEGPPTHRCRVGLCRQGRHGALRRAPRPRKGGNHGGFRRPHHPHHAHPRLDFGAARGGRLFPTRSAPASRRLTGSDVPAKLSTPQAEPTRPQRGRHRKSRATRDPGPAQSLVQSNRLLPRSLLGNTATATRSGTSKGAVPGISAEDSKYPRKGLWKMTSSGSGGRGAGRRRVRGWKKRLLASS